VSRRRTLLIALLALAATALVQGCGEGETAAGAAVSVYAAAPLCKGAQRELHRAGGEAGGLQVRAVCLASVEARGRAELAVAGANARRASEDTTSVAYLEAPGPAARFSRSIVESADIAWIEAASGAAALRRVLGALEGRGSSSPRAAVSDQVG
jgi:hypothetical protein